jgi:uncharacterized membrane protein
MHWFEKLLKYPPEYFRGGHLTFLSPVWGEVFVALFVGLAALAWSLYRRTGGRVSPRVRRVVLGLRIALLAIVCFMLAVPALSVETGGSKDAVFTAVMVDASGSMTVKDVNLGGGLTSRFDAARRLLGAPGGDGLLGKLGEHGKVIVYAFDRSARRVSGLDNVRPDGNATNLFTSLRDVRADLPNVPLAAVVMLTDGGDRDSALQDAASLMRTAGVPVHVVALGNPNPPRDYEVLRVVAPRTVRRNSEVDVYATVRYTGYNDPNLPFTVTITRGASTIVSQAFTPDPRFDRQRVRLTFTPDEKEQRGTYRLAVLPGKDEEIRQNNFKDFALEVRDDRLPVLYIEGSPRTEFRYMRRAMFRDQDFRVVSVLRLAQDRFYVQGENENETFLQRGFPDTPERLFAFQAVILGDIEASYFTPRQLQLLGEFVKARGGGLLMLGGVNSFGLGKYAGTPVAAMLPVEISDADPEYSDEEYAAKIAKDGLNHPVMRLAADPVRNARLWDKAPPLIGITPVRGVKPRAELLISDSRKGRPVLAAWGFGEGRVAAFTSGGSWFWRMSVPATDEFHEKFWKQLIRWLAVGAKQQLTVETGSEKAPGRASAFSLGEPVIIKASVLGKDLQPVNDAKVIATVTDPLGKATSAEMSWILSEDGVYQYRYTPEEEGPHKVSVAVEGWDVKPAETTLEVVESFWEFSDVGLKETALRRLAEQTGGRYFTPETAGGIPGLVADALRESRGAGVPPPKPIWDMPLLFGLLLALLASEWAIRRRRGLA